MKKLFTLLTLALMSIGSAWAQTTVFLWEGGETATVSGGTVVANGTNTAVSESVITVSAKKADIATNNVTISLDKALMKNDVINITGYRKKDSDANGNLYIKFDAGSAIDEGDNVTWNNIYFEGVVPNTNQYKVTDQTGSQTIQLARSKASTNVFITKIEIVRPASDVITPLGSFSESALSVLPGSSVTVPTLTIKDSGDNDISAYYDVEYSSNNTNVATVDPSTGEVTLVNENEGSVTITATLTHNDSGYDDGTVSYVINVSSELSYPYTWDFTTFETSGTWEQLVADTKNWGEKGTSTYQSLVEMKGTIAAGGVTIEETKFIKFGTFGKNKIYINKGSLQLNGSKLTISIPDLKAGYYVAIDFENPSGSESRGFKLTNVNEKESSDEIKLAASTRETRTFTVKEDGDIALTSTSGIRIYGISVTTEAPTVIVNTTNGFATFCSTAAVDFSESGAEVYTASVQGNNAVLAKVEDGKVPANTGVIIKAESETVEGKCIYNASALESNELIAATKEVNTEGIYILVADGESVKFTTMTSGTLTAGKAYLPAATATTSEARELNLVVGNATGISEVNAAVKSAELYNLNGVRVSQPGKGLYIQNGKKIIVK